MIFDFVLTTTHAFVCLCCTLALAHAHTIRTFFYSRVCSAQYSHSYAYTNTAIVAPRARYYLTCTRRGRHRRSSQYVCIGAGWLVVTTDCKPTEYIFIVHVCLRYSSVSMSVARTISSHYKHYFSIWAQSVSKCQSHWSYNKKVFILCVVDGLHHIQENHFIYIIRSGCTTAFK